jgi:hypothetical protein
MFEAMKAAKYSERHAVHRNDAEADQIPIIPHQKPM